MTDVQNTQEDRFGLGEELSAYLNEHSYLIQEVESIVRAQNIKLRDALRETKPELQNKVRSMIVGTQRHELINYVDSLRLEQIRQRPPEPLRDAPDLNTLDEGVINKLELVLKKTEQAIRAYHDTKTMPPELQKISPKEARRKLRETLELNMLSVFTPDILHACVTHDPLCKVQAHDYLEETDYSGDLYMNLMNYVLSGASREGLEHLESAFDAVWHYVSEPQLQGSKFFFDRKTQVDLRIPYVHGLMEEIVKLAEESSPEQIQIKNPPKLPEMPQPTITTAEAVVLKPEIADRMVRDAPNLTHTSRIGSESPPSVPRPVR